MPMPGGLCYHRTNCATLSANTAPLSGELSHGRTSCAAAWRTVPHTWQLQCRTGACGRNNRVGDEPMCRPANHRTGQGTDGAGVTPRRTWHRLAERWVRQGPGRTRAQMRAQHARRGMEGPFPSRDTRASRQLDPNRGSRSPVLWPVPGNRTREEREARCACQGHAVCAKDGTHTLARGERRPVGVPRVRPRQGALYRVWVGRRLRGRCPLALPRVSRANMTEENNAKASTKEPCSGAARPLVKRQLWGEPKLAELCQCRANSTTTGRPAPPTGEMCQGELRHHWTSTIATSGPIVPHWAICAKRLWPAASCQWQNACSQ